MSGIFPAGGVPSGQALGADPSIGNEDVTNCQNGALFYPTNRCPPRFDPKAANAEISEIVNLMQCAGLPYDCSKYNNLCQAVGKMIVDRMYGCLPQPFQPAGQACSIQYLVQTTDENGCRQISTYSQGSSFIAQVTTSSVWGLNYPSTLHPRAGQDTVGTHIYRRDQLGQDIYNNTVNESVLYGPDNQNLLAQMEFTIPCDSVIEVEYTQLINLDPKRNDGNGASSWVTVEIDGEIPIDDTKGPIGFGGMSNFLTVYKNSINLHLSAGTHKLRFFLLSYTEVPSQIPVVGNVLAGNAYWLARVATV